MIPAALTPEQQIARLREIALANPRAKLLPALHEVQRGARLAELRGEKPGPDPALLVDHVGQRTAMVAIITDLRSLEQAWKGGSNG